MAGPQYTSNAQGTTPFDVDTIVIKRYAISIPSYTSGPAVEPSTGVTTVYSGPADFQEGSGDTYYAPDGTVEEIAAICYIDTPPLPTVLVGDVLTGNSRGYVVVSVSTSTYALSFVRLLLKRGPLKEEQKG